MLTRPLNTTSSAGHFYSRWCPVCGSGMVTAGLSANIKKDAEMTLDPRRGWVRRFVDSRFRTLQNSPAAILACGLVMVLSGVLAAQTTPAVITACVNNTTAQMRILSSGTVCLSGETVLQWKSGGLPGAQGSQGAAGLPGGHGPQGVQGAAGAAGLAGAAGANGLAGGAGLPGSQGPAGSPGGTGLAGNAGSAGSAGSAGLAGLPGGAGSAGPVGSAGLAGLDGAAGAPGSAGSAGLPGAAGPAGGAGAAGPQGGSVAGAQGAAGPGGVAGAAGTLIPAGSISGTASCSGTAVPAGSLVYIPGRAFTAFVGSGGAFQFNGVPDGTYTVNIAEAGTNVATVSGVVVAGGAASASTTTACAASAGTACGTLTCVAPTPFCKTTAATNQCVQCLSPSNCGAGQKCTLGKCTGTIIN